MGRTGVRPARINFAAQRPEANKGGREEEKRSGPYVGDPTKLRSEKSGPSISDLARTPPPGRERCERILLPKFLVQQPPVGANVVSADPLSQEGSRCIPLFVLDKALAFAINCGKAESWSEMSRTIAPIPDAIGRATPG